MHDRAREGLGTYNNSALEQVVLPKLWGGQNNLFYNVNKQIKGNKQ